MSKKKVKKRKEKKGEYAARGARIHASPLLTLLASSLPAKTLLFK